MISLRAFAAALRAERAAVSSDALQRLVRGVGDADDPDLLSAADRAVWDMHRVEADAAARVDALASIRIRQQLESLSALERAPALAALRDVLSAEDLAALEPPPPPPPPPKRRRLAFITDILRFSVALSPHDLSYPSHGEHRRAALAALAAAIAALAAARTDLERLEAEDQLDGARRSRRAAPNLATCFLESHPTFAYWLSLSAKSVLITAVSVAIVLYLFFTVIKVVFFWLWDDVIPFFESRTQLDFALGGSALLFILLFIVFSAPTPAPAPAAPAAPAPAAPAAPAPAALAPAPFVPDAPPAAHKADIAPSPPPPPRPVYLPPASWGPR